MSTSLLSVVQNSRKRKATATAPVERELVRFSQLSEVVEARAWTGAARFQEHATTLFLWEFISGMRLPHDTALFTTTCFTLFTLLTQHMTHDGDDDDDDDALINRCFALHVIHTAIFDVCARYFGHLRHHVFHASRAGMSPFQWNAQTVVFACTSLIEMFLQNALPRWAVSAQRQRLTLAYLTNKQRASFTERARALFYDIDLVDDVDEGPCVCPKEFDVRVFCGTRSIAAFSQVECTLALQAACRGWRSARAVSASWDMWRYVDHLQQRCFELWMIEHHPRGVCNGCLGQMVESKDVRGYAVSDVWITHTATLFLYMRRVQFNAFTLLALHHIDAPVSYAACAAHIDRTAFSGARGEFHALVTGFYRWIRAQACKQIDVAITAALIEKVIKRACFRAGEKEEYMRMNKNDLPVQALERLSLTNTSLQLDWLNQTLLGMRVEHFFDRLRVPFTYADFMTLELVDAYFMQHTEYHWLPAVVLFETRMLRAGGISVDWAVKKHPFIVQAFGGFAVVANTQYFCVEFAAHAIVAWIVLTLTNTAGAIYDVRDENNRDAGRHRLDVSSILRGLVEAFTEGFE